MTAIDASPWKTWMLRVPERPFWIFFCSAFLFALGFSAYFFLYTVYLVDLHYSEASIGRIVAAASLGTMLATLPMGVLAGRFGVRPVLLVTVPAAALAFAVRAYVPGYAAQLALAALGGAALCAWGICLAPSVARLTDEVTRPFAFSVIFASGIGTVGIGSLIAGRLPGFLVGWSSAHGHAMSVLASRQATLLLASVTASLSVLPLLALDLGHPIQGAPLLRRPHPFLVRFLPVVALWTFVTSAFMPFATVYFTRQFNVPLVRMSTIFSLSQTVQCVAVLLAPFLFKRFGIGTSVMATQLVAACGLAALAATNTTVPAIVFYLGYIAMNYVSEPALFSLLMDRVPAEDRSGASSMQMLVAALVQSATAAVVGSGITRFGYSRVFACLALCTCFSAILFRRIASPAEVSVSPRDVTVSRPG